MATGRTSYNVVVTKDRNLFYNLSLRYQWLMLLIPVNSKIDPESYGLKGKETKKEEELYLFRA